METVTDRSETGEMALGFDGLRQGNERFSTLGFKLETDARQASGPVFHFSYAPTVTTGFIAFVFDIRREQK